MDWQWGWLPKDPPQHFGDNLVFDVLRLVVLVGAVLMIALSLRVLLEQRRRESGFPPGQVRRFVSLTFAAFYIGATELTIVGTVATPRLAVGLACVGIGLPGLRSARAKQRHEPVVKP